VPGKEQEGEKKIKKKKNPRADLYDEQIGDAEIGPEIVDEALHPAAIGRGIVKLDGITLPLEPQHGT